MHIHAVALDLGGSHATCAIVSCDDARVLATRTLEWDARGGLAPRLPELAAAVRALSAETGVRLDSDVGGVMGLPCIVESGTNRVLKTFNKYDDSPTLDLSGWARAELGLSLVIENDARLALLGEWHAGAARGFDDAVMLTFGTGIGGSAMMGGRLVTSKHAMAGANGGHFPVNLHGRRCSCGGVGCAEAEASTWSLPLVINDLAARFPEAARHSALLTGAGTGGPMNFRRVFDAARAGDALATAVRDHCLRVWATAAVINAQAYDAEVIVLGGGVLAAGEEVLGPVRAHVAGHAFTPWGTVTVRAAELGNEAALVGAVALLRSSKTTKPG